jgi:DNA-binding transcriptional MocR family regulator
VAQQANASGIVVEPVSHFSLRPPRRDGLVFGFASGSPEDLRAGIHTLAPALRVRTSSIKQ